jgi:hypothetical protein
MSGINETLTLRGTLKGHGDWVTSLATTPEDPTLLLSSSRDKSVVVWTLTPGGGSGGGIGEKNAYGFARRALRGHSHFVSDVVISSDGAFALSASWDSELRLWDIATGKTTRRFVGHDKDVLSVAFSVDNRQIVSGECRKMHLVRRERERRCREREDRFGGFPPAGFESFGMAHLFCFCHDLPPSLVLTPLSRLSSSPSQ